MVLKIHQCSQCHYKATKKGHLQTHQQSIHEGLKFPCSHCEYKATNKGALQTHIKSVHEGLKFPCTQCEYKASLKGALQTHIKSIHDSFSAISAYFQIMRREFCVFCVEPLQPTQGSWLVPLEPPKSPKRGPF